MPNSIQRMLHRASESVPGQRAIRLPWQEPTLGERTAETLEALADTSVDAEDRLATFNDRTTRRAQRAKRSTGDALASAREQARGSLDDAQSTAQDRMNALRAQTTDRVDDLRQSARDRASTLKRRASERGAAAADAASRAQRSLVDQMNAARQQGTTTDAGDADAAVDVSGAARSAERSAERAERASRAATSAASQMASALNRIVQSRGAGNLRAVVQEESPTDVEIRVDEAAESPLIRAADAVARVVAAATGTIYDYSGGHYGLEPVEADDLRRERKREERMARPVTIIEGRYKGDKKASKTERDADGRSRTPLLLGGLALVLAAVGVAYTQRDRLRPLYDQVMEQIRQRQAAMPQRAAPQRLSTTPIPTPAFNRVVSGQLMESGASTASAAPAMGASRAPGATDGASAASSAAADGAARTYVAGEPTP